jgi:hypothetical protein
MSQVLNVRRAAEMRDAARDEYFRSIRAASKGIPTRVLAKSLGVSQPYIVKASREAVSAYENSPCFTLDTLGQEIRGLLDSGASLNDLLRTVAQGITDFRNLVSAADHRKFLSEPASTGSVQWDAVLASVAEYECNRAGITAPVWCQEGRFVSPSWTFLTELEGLYAYVLVNTPAEFAARNIYVDRANLESV